MAQTIITKEHNGAPKSGKQRQRRNNVYIQLPAT